MSKWGLLVLAFACFSAHGLEGEAKALRRLSMTTDLLIAMGEQVHSGPLSGMLVAEDTLRIEFDLSTEFIYSFIIWTDSAFNYVDFWLTGPDGRTPRGSVSDHTTLTIIPDSLEIGTWSLGMELLEGADSDTAWYAATVFRAPRIRY